MKINLDILPMQQGHLDRCASLVDASRFFRDYGFTGQAARLNLARGLDRDDTDLRVALAEGGVLGFAWYVRDGAFDRSGYLRLLAVDDNIRGHGVGRALMEAFEEAYLMQTDILLLVTESNDLARGFYERLGYEHCGTLRDYVRKGVTECIYRKKRRSPKGTSVDTD